jgi:hypothetical protein
MNIYSLATRIKTFASCAVSIKDGAVRSLLSAVPRLAETQFVSGRVPFSRDKLHLGASSVRHAAG